MLKTMHRHDISFFTAVVIKDFHACGTGTGEAYIYGVWG